MGVGGYEVTARCVNCLSNSKPEGFPISGDTIRTAMKTDNTCCVRTDLNSKQGSKSLPPVDLQFISINVNFKNPDHLPASVEDQVS